jgi:ABC-2 type transport system permease protein
VTTILAVELRRALARRLVRVLVLMAVLGIAALAIGALVSSDPNSADAFSAGDIWSGDVADSGDANTLLPTSFLFFLMALLGGASLLGAEYKAGTITTLLTWQPRRAHVIAAKLCAAGAVAALVFIVLQTLLTLALVGVASSAGTTDGLDGDFYAGVVGLLLRGALITGGCAVLGGSLAAIGRNSTAALGVALGYLIIVEQILRGLRPGWQKWFLVENLIVTITGSGRAGDLDFDRSGAIAGLLLGAYLAVVVVAAGVMFVRRDVT